MKFSDSHRESIRQSRLGTKASEETKLRLSILRLTHPEWRNKVRAPSGAAMRYGKGDEISPRLLDFAFLCKAGYEMDSIIIPIPTGSYYQLDFGHREAKVNIEIDGSTHVGREERDKIRDEYLRSLGWKVIRIRI